MSEALSQESAARLLAGAAVPIVSDALDMLGIEGGLHGLRPVYAGAACCGPGRPFTT